MEIESQPEAENQLASRTVPAASSLDIADQPDPALQSAIQDADKPDVSLVSEIIEALKPQHGGYTIITKRPAE